MRQRKLIPAKVAAQIRHNLRSVRSATPEADRARLWTLLEEAHVLSQPWALPHVRVHGAMLMFALRTRDLPEVSGQLLRILVAGPGSISGRYPPGNTGRAAVPATQPMPIPDHLQALLDADA